MKHDMHDGFISSFDWQSFLIKDIFLKIQRGKRLKKEDHIAGTMPYISSTSANNGVDCFIGNDTNVRVFGDCLSLANSGSVGTCFYEPFSFVASDHVTSLHGNFSSEQYLFFSTMLCRLSEKYNFNREINDNRISRERVLLPIKQDGALCLDEIKKYISKIKINKTSEYINYATQQLSKIEYKEIPPLTEKTFLPFSMKSLFEIRRGEILYKQYMTKGRVPYVSATANSNGISDYTEFENRDGNLISLAYDGSVGSTFYHSYKWFASEKIVSLNTKKVHMNQFIALFLCTSIKNQKNKFNYGYKWSVGIRMNNTKIFLPVDEENNPDYAYMEQYIKNMMYKKYQSYLKYKNNYPN